MNIFVSNFITLGLIFGLGIQFAVGEVFDKKIERYFLIALFLILMQVVWDSVDYYLMSLQTLNNLRYVSSIIGYIIRPVTLTMAIAILLRDSKGRYIIMIWVPVVILSLMVITSPFTHSVFYFDKSNIFYRGPLGLLPHFVGALYLVMLIVIAFAMSNVIDKIEVYTIVYMSLLCAVAIALESIYGYKFLLPGAMIVSFAIYYIYLYVQINKVDVMTDLKNRRTLYNDVQKLFGVPMVVIAMDLNDLKGINDTEGHLAGDDAICTVAKIIKEMAGKRFRVYRVGGDEFLALGIRLDLEDAKNYVDDVRNELDKTPFSASFGYAMCNSEGYFEETCAKADAALYKDKQIQKQKNKPK